MSQFNVASRRSTRSIGAGRRRAFTLIELLVVIGVILVLVVATLPAFRALGEGTRSSGGVNGVSAALTTARSLASRHGRDVAVLFKFDVHRHVTSMQFVVFDRVVHDAEGGLDAATLFIPIDGQSEIELPKGVGVFGYGYGASRRANVATENWYTDLALAYENASREPYDPWLFPRTDPHFMSEDADEEDLKWLESFIVRFAPDGSLVTGAEELSNAAGGADDAYLELDYPGSETSEQGEYPRWSPRIIHINGEERQVVELQLRSVPFISVVDLYQLAEETGLQQPWLAVGEGVGQVNPSRVDANGDGEPDHVTIDKWIHINAPVISFNRYTGELMADIRR